MVRFTTLMTCLSLAMLTLAGCDSDKPAAPAGAAPTPAPAATGVAPLPASAIASTSPGASTPIKDLKASAKAGDTVTIRAVVGGRAEPFVADRAIMIVVDATLPRSCGIDPEDPCKTPWDYCCTAAEELKPHLATVQIVDAQGAAIKADLHASPVKPFDTIVLTGVVADRPDEQTLVINATSLFIEKTQ